MKPAFLAPRGMLERKPKHGEPCTNCGLCCVASLCSLGQHVFKRERFPGPCPGLMKDEADGTYFCDVARNPQAYAQRLSPSIKIGVLRHAALLIINAGTGCDARFNGEPSNPEFNRKMEEWDRRLAAALSQARRIWGMR
jgi:hypothetical protein